MTVYTDRIVLLFPIPAHGSHPARPAAASLQELEYTESGRVLENLVPLNVDAVGHYAEAFSLGAIAERDSLQSQVSALTAEKATLQAEIDRLTALIPPPLPPRSIYPRELLGRLTMAEVVAAIRSDDDAVIFAVANLQTTVSPVLLDSTETQMLIGSLVMAGILTPERMTEVLA